MSSELDVGPSFASGVKRLAETLRDDPGASILGIRQATVQSVQTDSCTIRIGGSTIDVPGIRWLANASQPQVNTVVWVIQNGYDLIIIGQLGGKWRDSVTRFRAAGDWTVSAASGWIPVDQAGAGAFDLTLSPVVAGQVVEISGGAFISNAGNYLSWDAASIVSGAAVNWWSTGTVRADFGIPTWVSHNMEGSIGGPWWKSLLAGDIVNGAVTIRLYVACNSGSHLIYWRPNIPVQFNARVVP